MSIVKSFSVGNGDMFYIKHGSDNFTICDVCLSEDKKDEIVGEIKSQKQGKNITRFISTHPDEDHFHGLEYLDDKIDILNFYCVKNEVIKEDKTRDFLRYCKLRDDLKKVFYLEKGCSRKWMNQNGKDNNDMDRGNSGINILWPITTNEYYKDALKNAEKGESTNNISIIMKYSLNSGPAMIWLGDLESDFMEKIKDEIIMEKVDILFAPHHGRNTGKVPESWLKKINPKIIIIGEAPSEDLNYYEGYDKISQNSAGDITLECDTGKVHIYVSNKYYSVDFLSNEYMNTFSNYIGTLNL